MAKAALGLILLGLLCVGALAQRSYVEVTIKWDNNLAQTKRAERAILEELSRELCKVPLAAVRTVATVDRSRFLNTETLGAYACIAPAATLRKVLDNCKSSRLRGNFKDELEDRTTPDQEAESITCTLRTSG